jgi:hypothetical protein
MRHGDIKTQVSIDLRHIRDYNNRLKFYSAEQHEEMIFAINEDTLGQICRFHNIPKREALLKLQSSQAPPPT